jgi:hypothetical protein
MALGGSESVAPGGEGVNGLQEGSESVAPGGEGVNGLQEGST